MKYGHCFLCLTYHAIRMVYNRYVQLFLDYQQNDTTVRLAISFHSIHSSSHKLDGLVQFPCLDWGIMKINTVSASIHVSVLPVLWNGLIQYCLDSLLLVLQRESILLSLCVKQSIYCCSLLHYVMLHCWFMAKKNQTLTSCSFIISQSMLFL